MFEKKIEVIAKKWIKNVIKSNGINKEDEFLVKSMNFENSKHNNEKGKGRNTLVKNRKRHKQKMCLFDHHNFLS